MPVRPGKKYGSFLTAAAVVFAAVIAACSTTKATGPVNTGNASKGDSVNLSGTYNLTSFTGCDGRLRPTVRRSSWTKTTYKFRGRVDCSTA